MKRGLSKPAAYSSTENPAGTWIGAPAGRGTTVGAPFGWASARVAREVRTRRDRMDMGSILHGHGRLETSREAGGVAYEKTCGTAILRRSYERAARPGVCRRERRHGELKLALRRCDGGLAEDFGELVHLGREIGRGVAEAVDEHLAGDLAEFGDLR